MDCVTTSQLLEQHAFPAFPTVSDSPLRPPLWLHVVSVVSNKEEILVPSDLLIEAIEKFMGRVSSIKAAFELSLT